MRNVQFIRQWRLLQRLKSSGRGFTIGTMAREEGVHPRTLKRDLVALREAGVPLVEQRVRGERWWRLADGHERLAGIPISEPELIALSLARALLRPLEGTDVARVMDGILAKVEASLAPPGRALLARLRAVVSGTPPRARYGDLLLSLAEATAERRTVEIDYEARRAPARRKIDPYAVRLHDGEVYLAAYDHQRRAMRLFAAERIRRMRPTGERFAPPDFDPDAWFGRALGIAHDRRRHEVRLWFAPEAAASVERRPWHPSQRVTQCPDGGIEVAVRVDGLREVAWDVLSYEPRARALAPPELVEMVAADLRAAARMYERVEEVKG